MWEIMPQTMFLYDTYSSLTTLLSTWQYFAGQPPLLTRIWGPERGVLWLPFLDLEQRSKSIFGIQSAPPLWTYIIWCWTLKACPVFNPYFAFRAPLCYEALNTKYGPAFNTKYSLKAGGRSECKIWVESGARSQHHIWLGCCMRAFSMLEASSNLPSLEARPGLMWCATELRF